MTTIKEHLRVACPYLRAREYLHDALSVAATTRIEQPLILTAPLPVGHLTLQKGVQVRYAAANDPMHFDEPWHVSWDPEPGGVYPSFSGVLAVRADDDYDSAILELTGSYAAPLGPAGMLFDKALGVKLASNTVQALLAQIATQMTARYQREEAAKTLRPLSSS